MSKDTTGLEPVTGGFYRPRKLVAERAFNRSCGSRTRCNFSLKIAFRRERKNVFKKTKRILLWRVCRLPPDPHCCGPRDLNPHPELHSGPLPLRSRDCCQRFYVPERESNPKPEKKQAHQTRECSSSEYSHILIIL